MLVRCGGTGRKGSERFEKDEHNRPETTLDSLARLKPAFRKDGTITASWKATDIARVEITEAFAVLATAVLRELRLAEDVVNVEAGPLHTAIRSALPAPCRRRLCCIR